MSACAVAPGCVWSVEGYAVLNQPLLERLEALDGLFRRWARELGAEEYAFPPAIAVATLQRVDYLASFPQLATFPASVEGTPAELRRFAERASREGAAAVELGRMEPITEVLTPAACYHVYELLQGSRLEGPVRVTTRATCFRREERYEPLRRQRAFQMRELVCVGTDAEVEDFLATLRGRLEALFAGGGLGVAFEQATDPFFAPERSAGYVMQKLLPLKTEMVLDGLAIGSLNRHGERFGRAFGIRRGGSWARSACVAFGLERWLQAVVSRHGIFGWPSWLLEGADD